MKWNKCILMLSIFVLFTSGLLQAQSNNRTLPFKGALSNEANGDVALIFRVYNQDTGMKLLEESQTVEVSDGRFTAFLGSKTPGGAKDLLASKTALWVEFAKVTAPDQVLGKGNIPTEPITGFPGACVLCYTCGGSWPYYGGSLTQGNYRELGADCAGPFGDRADAAYLCCAY